MTKQLGAVYLEDGEASDLISLFIDNALSISNYTIVIWGKFDNTLSLDLIATGNFIYSILSFSLAFRRMYYAEFHYFVNFLLMISIKILNPLLTNTFSHFYVWWP